MSLYFIFVSYWYIIIREIIGVFFYFEKIIIVFVIWKLDCREIKVEFRVIFRWYDNFFCYGCGWIVVLFNKWDIILIIIIIKNIYGVFILCLIIY